MPVPFSYFKSNWPLAPTSRALPASRFIANFALAPLALCAAQLAAAQTAADQTLPAITVKEEAAPETATGPVTGYRAKRAAWC